MHDAIIGARNVLSLGWTSHRPFLIGQNYKARNAQAERRGGLRARESCTLPSDTIYDGARYRRRAEIVLYR